MNTDQIEQGLENTVTNARETVSSFIDMTWAERWDAVSSWALHNGWILLQIVAIVVICRWLIKKIDGLINRIFIRRNVDSSINTFIRSMLRIAAWLMVIIFVVSIVGIKTTSIAALVAAIGFAIGMALSGTLQNFAGGIMILLLKPFRTGDYIQAQGYEGTIKEIKLFNTVMRTSDNKTVIIPNGGLSTNIVNNFSSSGTRRVEWTFGMTFGNDYDRAENTMREILDNDDRIWQSPPYFIALKGLDGGVMSIIVRAWVATGDYWDVFYDVNERVYKLFPLRGLALVSGGSSVNVNINGQPAEESKPSSRKQPAVEVVDKTVDNVAAQAATQAASQTAEPVPETKQTKAEESRILSKCSDMKDSDNSAASMDDSHDKLQGIKDNASAAKDPAK